MGRAIAAGNTRVHLSFDSSHCPSSIAAGYSTSSSVCARVKNKLPCERCDIRTLGPCRYVLKLRKSGNDGLVLIQHVRQLRFQPACHVDGRLHLGRHSTGRDRRQEPEWRQREFLFADEVCVKDASDLSRNGANFTGPFRRPHQFAMQFVAFGL